MLPSEDVAGDRGGGTVQIRRTDLNNRGIGVGPVATHGVTLTCPKGMFASDAEPSV